MTGAPNQNTIAYCNFHNFTTAIDIDAGATQTVRDVIFADGGTTGVRVNTTRNLVDGIGSEIYPSGVALMITATGSAYGSVIDYVTTSLTVAAGGSWTGYYNGFYQVWTGTGRSFRAMAAALKGVALGVLETSGGPSDVAPNGYGTGLQVTRPSDGAFVHHIYGYTSTGTSASGDNLAIAARGDIVLMTAGSERLRVGEDGSLKLPANKSLIQIDHGAAVPATCGFNEFFVVDNPPKELWFCVDVNTWQRVTLAPHNIAPRPR